MSDENRRAEVFRPACKPLIRKGVNKRRIAENNLDKQGFPGNEGFREAALAHRNLRGERDDPDPLSARLSAVLAAPKGRAPDLLKAYSESV